MPQDAKDQRKAHLTREGRYGVNIAGKWVRKSNFAQRAHSVERSQRSLSEYFVKKVSSPTEGNVCFEEQEDGDFKQTSSMTYARVDGNSMETKTRVQLESVEENIHERHGQHDRKADELHDDIQDVLKLLRDKDSGPEEHQSDKDRLKQIRRLKRALDNESSEIKEREAERIAKKRKHVALKLRWQLRLARFQPRQQLSSYISKAAFPSPMIQPAVLTHTATCQRAHNVLKATSAAHKQRARETLAIIGSENNMRVS